MSSHRVVFENVVELFSFPLLYFLSRYLSFSIPVPDPYIFFFFWKRYDFWISSF